MKKLSLRYALLIYGLLVLLLLSLMTTFWLQYRQSMARLQETSVRAVAEATDELLKQQVAVLMLATTQQLANPLYYTDYAGLYRALKYLAQSPQVRFLYVYDPRGRILHDGRSSIPRYGEPVPYALARTALKSGRLRFARMPETLLAAMPITLGNTVIGGLLIGFSLETLQSAQADVQGALARLQREAQHSGLVILAISFTAVSLVGLALAWALGRHLSHPIGQLISQAKELSELAPTATVAVSRDDELGELSRVLAQIAARLQETTVSRDYLERIVNNLTEALLVVNFGGKIIFFNQRIVELSGYSPEQLLGLPLTEIVETGDEETSGRREG